MYSWGSGWGIECPTIPRIRWRASWHNARVITDPFTNVSKLYPTISTYTEASVFYQRFSRQILQAIAYLHECHIVHHDIKPSHFVLATKGATIKLIDFGVAVDEQCPDFSMLPYESLGTPMFQAPELVDIPDKLDSGDPVKSTRSPRYALDIWAAGITM